MKTYVLIDNPAQVQVARCSADSVEHAKVKFNALHGVEFKRVGLSQDYHVELLSEWLLYKRDFKNWVSNQF